MGREKPREPIRGGGVLLAVALAALALTAVIFAWQAGVGGHGELWFNRYWWAVFLAICLGLMLAAFTRRTDAYIEDGKILRHDLPARLSHWCHALSTVLLLVSGCAMGCLFIPNIITAGATNAMMNVHFVGVLVFLFATFYYLGNSFLTPGKLREHLPDRNVVDYTLRHFKLMFGSKKVERPYEEKYLASERGAYVMAVVLAALLIISGICKALAHVLDMPGPLMGFMNVTHDVCALLMILFVVAHVVFAVFAPHAFPMFKSMLTGWMPLDHAREEHPAWVDQVEQGLPQGRPREGAHAREAPPEERGAAKAPEPV